MLLRRVLDVASGRMTMDFWLPLAIQLVVLLITGAAALWRISRARERDLQDMQEKNVNERKKLREDIEKVDRWLRDKLDSSQREDAEKRSAIYAKMEDAERRYEEIFVRQQTCKILHGALKEATNEIGSDVKKLLRGQGGGQ
jgi:hypothetical protein